MTDKFNNKYRIPSARLQNWDYRWAGAYFITICTQNREHYFGEIENGEMQLSSIGIIADVMWHEIKNHSKTIEFDSFVVMPNHIHGILILNGIDTDIVNDNGNVVVETGHAVETGHVVAVETGHALSLQSQSQSQSQTEKTIGQKRFQNIGNNSISSIVGSYKSAVTKHTHRLGFEFNWQTRFYDHIIRNDDSFKKIQTYIGENPAKWHDDKFYD